MSVRNHPDTYELGILPVMIRALPRPQQTRHGRSSRSSGLLSDIDLIANPHHRDLSELSDR